MYKLVEKTRVQFSMVIKLSIFDNELIFPSIFRFQRFLRFRINIMLNALAKKH